MSLSLQSTYYTMEQQYHYIAFLISSLHTNLTLLNRFIHNILYFIMPLFFKKINKMLCLSIFQDTHCQYYLFIHF